MAFIHGDTKLTYLDMDKAGSCDARRRGNPPPVLSHNSLQIFISAASATTEIRILFFTHASRVSWMLPGSQVVNELNMIMISRDEWVGRWLAGVRQNA